MSAIFGVLRFDGAAVSASELQRMGAVLAHRGPDGRRSVADGRVGLGHCLLRVNQEDLFEAQPVRDPEAELTLVADCRIDNREALAAAFGLDYVALDCAEDRQGRLLVFEADTAMIVHDMDPPALYPYKRPAMRKLFAAFQALIAAAVAQRRTD